MQVKHAGTASRIVNIKCHALCKCGITYHTSKTLNVINYSNYHNHNHNHNSHSHNHNSAIYWNHFREMTSQDGCEHLIVLVLNMDHVTIKRMLTTWHPYTQATFSSQSLQADIGKRMLPSPPSSLLPRYGRNRIRAGRRTKTRLKRVIQSNVFLVRLPCQNPFIADGQQWSHILPRIT